MEARSDMDFTRKGGTGGRVNFDPDSAHRAGSINGDKIVSQIQRMAQHKSKEALPEVKKQ